MIDELRADELRSIALTIGESRRALEANADAVSAAQRAIHDLTEQIEEMGDARARFAALPPAPAGAASDQLLRLTQDVPVTEDDLRELDDAVRQLENWRAALLQFNEDQTRRLLKPTLRQNSKNGSVMSQAVNAVSALIDSANEHFTQFASRIGGTVNTLQQVRDQIETIRATQNAEVSKAQEQNSVVGQAIRARTEAQQAVDRLTALEARRNAEREKLRELIEKSTSS